MNMDSAGAAQDAVVRGWVRCRLHAAVCNDAPAYIEWCNTGVTLHACTSYTGRTPLIGLSGLGSPNDLTHEFQQSYLKSTVPPPLGKGAASTSSNHLPRSHARRLPLFDAP